MDLHLRPSRQSVEVYLLASWSAGIPSPRDSSGKVLQLLENMAGGKYLMRELNNIQPLELSPLDGSVVKVKTIYIHICALHLLCNVAGAALLGGS